MLKSVVTTLNAKYIHRSLAVRLLYVANKDRFDISFKEYTIKEDIETIAGDLLSTGCDCIGLGVYIWNVRQIQQLVIRLKELNPEIILILGGPEVSYEPEFFLKNTKADFIISGEGEFVLGELLNALENHLPVNIDGVSSPGNISRVIARADLHRLVALPSPYQLIEDRESLNHQLIYFETSRGCPYQCSYCLSSLEKGIRYFPYEYITKNLQYLMDHGTRQIKFLDRTFNLNRKHTQRIFDFLIDHYREGLTFQFEIYADLLDDATINFLNTSLPKHFFRFEIGVQSSFEPSNKAVNRKQDFTLLSHNIKKLTEGGKIDLHLDLIAGLPYETYGKFVQSFNDVFVFRAKEIQLGFLKMLRGTSIRRNASKHGYVFQEEAPYQIISNRYLSGDELCRIHEAEHTLEKYWNSGRFPLTMNTVFNTAYKDHYFEFFDELAQFCKQHHYRLYQYQLVDLFRYLHAFLESKKINLFHLLQEDYYHHFTTRPTGVFWQEDLSKKERKQLFNQICQDKNFLEKHQLNPYHIKKQTMIDRKDNTSFMLTVFLSSGRKKLEYLSNHPS
ncbi:MAG: B12-binding domain-containing radical SAM protein [Bacteroidales bacterium]|jgi:radical SAM superfamily enzyme YgiQ (UPF0313 family)|nr:B12-binding domain-containing radical SAM protein [Bacteroidales bacterium]